MRTDWQLAPQFSRAQELLYHGTVRDESLSRVQYAPKQYRLEVRALVLDVRREGAEVAFLTTLQQHGNLGKRERPDGGEPVSARLERALVDAQGNLRSLGKSGHSHSLDGPSTWEAGFFLEVPRQGVPANGTWLVEEPGRPACHYRLIGPENVLGVPCVKLVVRQQSEDWDKPRGDSTAWRRTETIWILPASGLAQKVVREVERREPAHTEPTSRIVTEYQLLKEARFENFVFQEQLREISQIQKFRDELDELLPEAPQHGPKPFEALLARIDDQLKHHATSSYREALQRERRRALAGHRGEKPIAMVEPMPAVVNVAVVGKAAPVFAVEEVLSGKAWQLRNWQGKTLVMIFYRPDSQRVETLLTYAESLVRKYNRPDCAVVGFAMLDQPKKVAQLHQDLNLTFPTLNGITLRPGYAVDTTPRLVVVDAQGIVRGIYEGLGPEPQDELEKQIRKCLLETNP
jgi:hypothetical protein